MIFRECTAYKLLGFDVNQDRLNQAFSQFCFTPAHETSRNANGFVSPISERPDDFAVQIQHIVAFNLRFDEKKVPAKKVNALTDKRVAEIEAKGTNVTKQLKSDIRENAEKDLLKLELPNTTLVYGFIDSKDGWIYFNSKSARVCESALALIRKALGSFRVLPVTTKSAPSHFLCLSLCEEYVHLADGMIIDTGGKIKAVGDKPSHKVSFDGVEIGEYELKVLSGTDIVQADLLIREEFDNPESNSWTFTLTTQKGNEPFALSKLNYAPKSAMDCSPYEEKNDIDFFADLLISANLLSLVFQRLGDSFGGFVDFEDFTKETK
ncbi:recombination-associated protein RdgC [Shewanella frigidimarina]|uniref:recombination-associated protein RdgC n=1 Tax=Shewanella frigidimarina TaxID=56812 RepID=UPI003D7C1299